MQNKIVIINALDSETYQDCHIKGSISMPLAELKTRAQTLDKHAETVVYCASNECPVGGKAWYVLHGLGFTNVYELSGGLRSWKEKGYPTEGACQAHYLKPPFGKPLPEDSNIKKMTVDELRAKQ